MMERLLHVLVFDLTLCGEDRSSEVPSGTPLHRDRPVFIICIWIGCRVAVRVE
jgi:hypothetical protein